MSETEFTMKKDTKPVEIKVFTTEYSRNGQTTTKKQADWSKKSREAIAKIVCKGEIVRYYILQHIKGHLYNPSDIGNELITKHIDYRGRNAWEFVEVTEKSFDYYVKFLETQNPAYLSNAGREMKL